MKRNNIKRWAALGILMTSTGCAERKTRIWIDPPIGYESSTPKKLYYQVEDVSSGKRENLTIPLEQTPENLVVEQRKSAGSAPEGTQLASSEATKADREIRDGKLPDIKAASAPTISYLRELKEIEGLYGKQQYNEALIRITPLSEQYPGQARLFIMQGTLYRKIGENKLALQAYQRAQKLEKNNPEIEEAVLRIRDEIGGT